MHNFLILYEMNYFNIIKHHNFSYFTSSLAAASGFRLLRVPVSLSLSLSRLYMPPTFVRNDKERKKEERRRRRREEGGRKNNKLKIGGESINSNNLRLNF